MRIYNEMDKIAISLTALSKRIGTEASIGEYLQLIRFAINNSKPVEWKWSWSFSGDDNYIVDEIDFGDDITASAVLPKEMNILDYIKELNTIPPHMYQVTEQ